MGCLAALANGAVMDPRHEDWDVRPVADVGACHYCGSDAAVLFRKEHLCTAHGIAAFAARHTKARGAELAARWAASLPDDSFGVA